jgi:hypothetical protein
MIDTASDHCDDKLIDSTANNKPMRDFVSHKPMMQSLASIFPENDKFENMVKNESVLESLAGLMKAEG